MKKGLAFVLTAAFCLAALTGCGSSKTETKAAETKAETTAETQAAEETQASGETTKLTVAASPTPHAEILSVAKEILAEKDITLTVKEYTDYVQPNNVVESGEIDANYFQHVPYLDDFNAQNGTHIVSVATIHVEPLGLYGGKQTTLDALK